MGIFSFFGKSKVVSNFNSVVGQINALDGRTCEIDCPQEGRILTGK
jgi:hypothetical protein